MVVVAIVLGVCFFAWVASYDNYNEYKDLNDHED